ncbi:hypothetical protein QMO56_02125 [Roseomonas sp. E05]|uniref:hypothetical protein n=1 Tax=Roseomonas sp. E05 TaxID=3046310 RepID=UPI0024BA56A1|nr:hypothetical protein [Roseomonas sp. E05]MDJ0386898.1 hypothetical protein [Roseomonas sp. E05]
MKASAFMGVGAAIAALASSPVLAQDANTQTINQNLRQEYYENSTSTQRVINEGIPKAPHQAPSLGLGNIYGLNPCATGVSLGATTPLFGIGGAFSNIDQECQTRNNAAVLVSGLRDEAAAREVLCTIPTIREAFVRVGRPCISDGGRPTVLPSNFPAGAGQSGNYVGDGVGVAGTQLPPTALPPATSGPPMRAPHVNGDPRLRSEAAPDAPAFCLTPGLDISLYPECIGGRTAGNSPRRPSEARKARAGSQPGQAQVTRRPEAAPEERREAPSRQTAPADASRPSRPVLGSIRSNPANCEAASTAVQRLYAECTAARMTASRDEAKEPQPMLTAAYDAR